MSYFAAALARTDDGWTGRELDLDEVDDLESLAEELRELSGDAPGPALLLLEEDDEYVALVRVDGGA
ncbi:MAG: tRNA adenosine deaminase-associated protein, partial [Mycobacteriales bacterium]